MTGGATPGKGPDELRRQIEQTREELGRTVEELASRADVKTRTREKAREARDQVGHTASEVARRVREKVPQPVHDKADQAAHRVRDTASRAGHMVQDHTPEPIRERTDRGMRTAMRHRGALLAGTTALAAVLLLARHRRASAHR